jgi:hypothetical protein
MLTFQREIANEKLVTHTFNSIKGNSKSLFEICFRF